MTSGERDILLLASQLQSSCPLIPGPLHSVIEAQLDQGSAPEINRPSFQAIVSNDQLEI